MLLTVFALLGVAASFWICTVNSLGFGWGILIALGGTLAALVLFLLLVALLSVFIRIDRPADRRTRFYRWLATNLVELGEFLLRVRVHTQGMERIPQDSRFLLVCNHRTIFDPPITMAALSQFGLAFISKKENYQIPIVNKLMHMCFCLPLDREDNRAAVRTINEAVELLDDNVVSMGIYPEGKCNLTEEILLPFRNGAFKIAQKAKVPIVIATIHNTTEIMKNFPHRATDIYLNILDVLPYGGEVRAQTKDISEYVWPVMYEDLCRPMPRE